MKRIMLTLVPPVLGIFISTQGGLAVEEVHAERFDPSDSYSLVSLNPIQKSNELDVLNKNQDILNISKRDEAKRIVGELRLSKDDRDKFFKMLDSTSREDGINDIVNVALMNVGNNNASSSEPVDLHNEQVSSSYNDIAEIRENNDSPVELLEGPLESTTYNDDE